MRVIFFGYFILRAKSNGQPEIQTCGQTFLVLVSSLLVKVDMNEVNKGTESTTWSLANNTQWRDKDEVIRNQSLMIRLERKMNKQGKESGGGLDSGLAISVEICKAEAINLVRAN